MFSSKQLLALAAVVLSSSVDAACVRNGGGSASVADADAATPTSSSSYPVATTSSASSSSSSSVAAAYNAASQTSGAAASSSSSSSSSSGDGTKYLVVFGDSYSSTGFYMSDTSHPTAQQPIGTPDLPGSTTSGGLNWVGYATSEYNTSLVLTYDWAYYGADVSNDLINTGVTTDVVAQVGEFEASIVPAPDYAPWTADSLLVAVWIGINDVGQCFWEAAEYATCPIDSVMTQYFDLLQDLYDDGVRNFVLNTVPPFYKAPAFDQQSTDSIATLTANLDEWNAQLASNLATFAASNADIATATVFNTSAAFWAVLDDPAAYGLDAADAATCANADGTSCVWYDNYHPGQAVHKLVAQRFVDALTGSFF